MPRAPATQPSYQESRQRWVCWHEGRTVVLANGPKFDKETVDKAFKLFYELKAHALDKLAQKDDTLVSVVMSQYIHRCKRDNKKKTYENAMNFAGRFRDEYGHLKCSELTVGVVTDWLEKMSQPRKHSTKGNTITWGPQSRVNAVRALKAAFNYAVTLGTITRNPIILMKTPQGRSRGKECIIEPQEHEKILAEARRTNPGFALLIEAVHDTGARPGEIANLTAKEFKYIQGVPVLDLRDWKTRHHGGCRVIILGPFMERLCKQQIASYPEGLLFPTSRGTLYDDTRAAATFGELRERAGVRKGVTLYSYRHTFCTNWLLAGKSPLLLCQLVGNTLKVLEKHYSHLMKDMGLLRRHLLDFKGQATPACEDTLHRPDGDSPAGAPLRR
jgi:site-specific recombinase XerD